MDAKDALVGFARLPGAQIVIGNSHQPVLIKQGMTFADSDNQQTDAAPQAGSISGEQGPIKQQSHVLCETRTTLPVYEDKQAVAPAFAKCSGGHGKVGSVGQVDAANQDTSTTVPGMQQPETAVPEAGRKRKRKAHIQPQFQEMAGVPKALVAVHGAETMDVLAVPTGKHHVRLAAGSTGGSLHASADQSAAAASRPSSSTSSTHAQGLSSQVGSKHGGAAHQSVPSSKATSATSPKIAAPLQHHTMQRQSDPVEQDNPPRASQMQKARAARHEAGPSAASMTSAGSFANSRLQDGSTAHQAIPHLEPTLHGTSRELALQNDGNAPRPSLKKPDSFPSACTVFKPSAAVPDAGARSAKKACIGRDTPWWDQPCERRFACSRDQLIMVLKYPDDGIWHEARVTDRSQEAVLVLWTGLPDEEECFGTDSKRLWRGRHSDMEFWEEELSEDGGFFLKPKWLQWHMQSDSGVPGQPTGQTQAKAEQECHTKGADVAGMPQQGQEINGQYPWKAPFKKYYTWQKGINFHVLVDDPEGKIWMQACGKKQQDMKVLVSWPDFPERAEEWVPCNSRHIWRGDLHSDVFWDQDLSRDGKYVLWSKWWNWHIESDGSIPKQPEPWKQACKKHYQWERGRNLKVLTDPRKGIWMEACGQQEQTKRLTVSFPEFPEKGQEVILINSRRIWRGDQYGDRCWNKTLSKGGKCILKNQWWEWQMRVTDGTAPVIKTPKSNSGEPGSVPKRFLDVASTDKRPIVVWDLNGTLTCHTAAKNSSGQTIIRDGIRHLRRLEAHFRQGIFTSATLGTVEGAIPRLEKAAGPGPPLFDRSLILHRGYTQLAPASHRAAKGKAWDTVKPLGKFFRFMHRVLLCDDDAFKALPDERNNMVVVQCWDHTVPEDEHLKLIVDAILAHCKDLNPVTDLRPLCKKINAAVRGAAAHH